MKKLIAFLLVFCMLLSFAACGNSSATKDKDKGEQKREFVSDYDKTKYNEPGTFPIFKEKKTITIMLPDSAYVEDWNTNTQTLLMEERLNADLKITAIPSKEFKTKISLMVSSGGEELADAVMGKFNDSELWSYSQSEQIIPVTDYYYNTSIAYYLNGAKERMGYDYFPEITAPDGEIYGVAHYNDSIATANPDKMFIYKPWLDKLGVDPYTIVTPEDYKQLLIKIRDTDLNGNGLHDEIPNVQSATNASWFQYFMNPYIYAGDNDYFVVNDGKVSFAFQTEEWREGLRYMKSLVDEKLFSPLTLTQDSASMKALLNNDITIVGTFSADGIGTINANDPRRQEYWAIGPLQGKDGQAIASFLPEVADIRMIISKNAADPESTFRMGDLMVSKELSMHTRWGEEGVDYIKAGPNDESKFAFLGYKAEYVSLMPWSIRQNKHWYQTGPYIRERDIIGAFAISEGLNEISEQPQIEYEGKNPKEYVRKLNYTVEENDVVNEYLGHLIDYVNETSKTFITGEKNLDTDWEDFQDQIEALKAEELLEIVQAAYDRMQVYYDQDK